MRLEAKAHKCYPLDQSPLYCLTSKKKLAHVLQSTVQEINSLIGRADNYNEFCIVTKSGKRRHIQEPKRVLKKVHKRIADLLGRINPGDYLSCPVKRRSYITNAAEHISRSELFKIDIKEYFPSTTDAKITRFFRVTMRCSPDVAYLLTKLCTVNGKLPTGSPISPFLSFYAHKELWDSISRIAADAGCKMTVYMDDIVVSGNPVPGELVWSIKKMIRNYGLKYHKEHKYSTTRPKIITGVAINDGKLCLPNKQHLKIYQLRREMKQICDDERRKILLNRLRGCLAQASQIASANTSA